MPSESDDRFSHWCGSNDPAAREAVVSILISYFTEHDDLTLEKLITKLLEFLAKVREPYIRQAQRSAENALEASGIPGVEILPFLDDVDILVRTYEDGIRPFASSGADLQDLLLLYALHAFRSSQAGLGLKAYFVGIRQRAEEGLHEWNKILRGRRKGGRKSGSTKKQMNADRDQDICRKALLRLKDGDDRGKIVADLAETHGLGTRRIQQILSQHCPNWPRPGK